ncbi:MAG TPA: DUF861 domain-containing protein [Candidatus Avidesulfovibrio excrementigallinarum]|nr:DUF861 domain-containing protein [Candidatus Avidesulfovibrio excrementigallinarum]
MAQRQLITAETVRQAHTMGLTQIGVQPGAIVTWQARDDAAQLGIVLAPGAASGEASGATAPAAVPPRQGVARFGSSIPVWASVPLTTLPPAHKPEPVIAAAAPAAGPVKAVEPFAAVAAAPAAMPAPAVAGPAVLAAPAAVSSQPATQAFMPAALAAGQTGFAFPAASQPAQPAASGASNPMLALASALMAGLGAEQLRQLGQAFLTLAEQAQNLGKAACAPEQSSQQQVPGMQENQPLVPASSFGLPFVIQPAVPAGAPSYQAAPAQQSAGCSAKAAIDLNTDDIFSAVREQVLARVPAGTDPAIIDGMIRKALTEQGPGCGGSCVRCIKAASQAAGVAPQPGAAWLQKTASAARVDSRALPLSPSNTGVGMMEVIAPESASEMPAVGYVEWERGAFPWTFARAEALVVLEGELTVRVDGQVLTAGPGDVLAFDKDAQVTFEAQGRVRYAAVAPAVRG